MITCPSCGKENADNSAHCGFCGYQLQEGGKKTMFGMAALDADALKRAAAEAKAASSAAAEPSRPAAEPSEPADEPQGPNADPFGQTQAMDAVAGSGETQTDRFEAASRGREEGASSSSSSGGGAGALPPPPTEPGIPEQESGPARGFDAGVGRQRSEPNTVDQPLQKGDPGRELADKYDPQTSIEASEKDNKSLFVIVGIVAFFVLLGCIGGAVAIGMSML